MPPREWKLRIQDILDSIEAICRHVNGMDSAGFASDAKTIDAVLHRFAVIGEAATAIPPEVVQANPQLPWREMRAMRNLVVHAYFGVKLEIVWDTIQNDLPPLLPALKKLFA